MSNTWFVIVMIALVFAGPAGQAFEWHWVNPLPQGNSIYGGWTSPDGEIGRASCRERVCLVV